MLIKSVRHVPTRSFQNDNAFIGWLQQVVRTTGLYAWRDYRVRHRDISDSAYRSVPACEAQASSDEQEDYWERGEGHAVYATYQQLPPRIVELIWLRLSAGIPWAEAGAELGISKKTAERSYCRALARLRASVREGKPAP